MNTLSFTNLCKLVYDFVTFRARPEDDFNEMVDGVRRFERIEAES